MLAAFMVIEEEEEDVDERQRDMAQGWGAATGKNKKAK